MKEEYSEEIYLKELENAIKNNSNKKAKTLVSYQYLEQKKLLQNEKIISELKSIVERKIFFSVKKEAYETCKKVGVDCKKPMHDFKINENECIKMVPIFEYMKSKKWLKKYNAPKFRQAYNHVYGKEYSRLVKNMSDKTKKATMFKLYRKYYMIFIEDGQFQHWIEKRNRRKSKVNESQDRVK